MFDVPNKSRRFALFLRRFFRSLRRLKNGKKKQNLENAENAPWKRGTLKLFEFFWQLLQDREIPGISDFRRSSALAAAAA